MIDQEKRKRKQVSTIYYLTRFFIIVACLFFIFLFVNFSCERLSGSYNQVSLIEKELVLLSFPKNTLMSSPSYTHRYNQVDLWAYYGIPSNEKYTENKLTAFYNIHLIKNGWHFLKKEKRKLNLQTKDHNTYKWKKNDYILEIGVYSSHIGFEKYFHSLGYGKNDLVYTISIYWRL